MPSLLRPASRFTGRRVAPWLMAADLAREGRNHWTEQLTPVQRHRLVELLKESRGRYGNLNERQQKELRKLIGLLDVPLFARHAAGAVSGFRDTKRKKKR